MLVIKVELWPYGIKEARETIASATIANAGRDPNGCTYRAQIQERGDAELGIPSLDEAIQITGHDRRQSVWALIERVLHESPSLALRDLGHSGRRDLHT